MKFIFLFLIIIPYVFSDSESDSELSTTLSTGSAVEPETEVAAIDEVTESLDKDKPIETLPKIPAIDGEDYAYFDYSMGPYPGYSGEITCNLKNENLVVVLLFAVCNLF